MRLYASHFTCFKCTCANINAFWFTVHEDADFLNVYAPSAAVFIVCVRNVITFSWCFTSKEAFARHGIHLLQVFREASRAVIHASEKLTSEAYAKLFAILFNNTCIIFMRAISSLRKQGKSPCNKHT